MADEKLEQQAKDVAEKLKKRDELERKKGEAEFRKAMDKDTAGTVMGMFQLQQTQLAGLQAQIDATNPLAPLMREVANIGARLAALEAAVFAKSRKEVGQE